MFVWETYGGNNIAALKSFLGHRGEILCVSLLEEISESITFFATSSTDQTGNLLINVSENMAYLR